MSGTLDTPIYRRFDLQRDLAPLVSLLQQVEQADQTGEAVTEAALRERLTWAGQDPALMIWVATLPHNASLVGYGRVQKTPHDENADLHIAVHPSWRRQGIGGHLFVHLLERATDLGTRALRAYADVQHEGASRFVCALGFSPVSSYTRLRVSAQQPFPARVLPEGFRTRSYDQIQRVDLYTEAMNHSYEGLWGHVQVTEEDVAGWLPHLNPAGIFLLFAPDDTLAGTCRAELSAPPTPAQGAPTGLIDAPGVIPQWRDAQLTLPLLFTAIHWLLPQGPTTLELESWGDAPGTLALYRALGFRVIKEEISYRRKLE
ncbi:MAG TPA: GNAT family N-acetyltransferase [Ktedonobacterales bacterium]|jgi:mycothiol synthase|nr:GNAT family N-acetyltransferase [Ktedonobacterales bacterium]